MSQGRLFEGGGTTRPTQMLVGFFVRGYRSRTKKRPPERVLGQVSRQLALLVSHHERQVLEQALDDMLDKALSPTLLPQLAAQAELRQNQLEASAYVAEHGWPTGWRFVRSGPSGTHVPDTLGHDYPPKDAPSAPRPSLQAIAAALRERAPGP